MADSHWLGSLAQLASATPGDLPFPFFLVALPQHHVHFPHVAKARHALRRPHCQISIPSCPKNYFRLIYFYNSCGFSTIHTKKCSINKIDNGGKHLIEQIIQWNETDSQGTVPRNLALVINSRYIYGFWTI